MVQVMRTMAEVATNETIQQLSRLVKESLKETAEFWRAPSNESKLLSLLDVTEANAEEANAKFRSLVTLHVRITLLSDVFSTTGYAHGRSAINLLQTLMNSTAPEMISDLGTLHRASIWENIVFNAGLIAKGIDLASAPTEQLEGLNTPLDFDALDQDEGTVLPPPPPPAAAATAPNGDEPRSETTEASAAPAAPSQTPSQPEHRITNAAAIKHLTHGLPNILAPFFQGKGTSCLIPKGRVYSGSRHSYGENLPRPTEP